MWAHCQARTALGPKCQADSPAQKQQNRGLDSLASLQPPRPRLDAVDGGRGGHLPRQVGGREARPSCGRQAAGSCPRPCPQAGAPWEGVGRTAGAGLFWGAGPQGRLALPKYLGLRPRQHSTLRTLHVRFYFLNREVTTFHNTGYFCLYV